MGKKEKIKLPDSVLDAMSGGVLYFEGRPVVDIHLYTDAIVVFTDRGSETLAWAPEEQAAMDRDPVAAMDHIDGVLTRLHDSQQVFEFTEVFSVKPI